MHQFIENNDINTKEEETSNRIHRKNKYRIYYRQPNRRPLPEATLTKTLSNPIDQNDNVEETG